MRATGGSLETARVEEVCDGRGRTGEQPMNKV